MKKNYINVYSKRNLESLSRRCDIKMIKINRRIVVECFMNEMFILFGLCNCAIFLFGKVIGNVDLSVEHHCVNCL